MPVLGYRRYGRTGGPYPPPPNLPIEISVKLLNMNISSSYDNINGRLCLTSQRNSFDCIKICLKLYLKLAKDGANTACNEIDLFEQFPIETELFSPGEFCGRKKLDFLLNIPKDRILPTPFISSIGSLSYRLVALITKDKNKSWEIIVNKLLMDFKGNYNVSGLEFEPSVDLKQFLEGKITTIFTLNKPVLLIRRDTVLSATLELEGILAYNVDVTVKFLRTTKIGENVKTEIISLQKQQANSHENINIFKWNFDVSSISTATYANELTPVYSVRYFIKYEVSFKPPADRNLDDGVHGHGYGIVEVKVGTTFDNSSASGSETAVITEHLEKMTLTARRSSVTSMLTLPPAYSQLSSRTGSVMSLETQPPSYDDLYEDETTV